MQENAKPAVQDNTEPEQPESNFPHEEQEYREKHDEHKTKVNSPNKKFLSDIKESDFYRSEFYQYGSTLGRSVIRGLRSENSKLTKTSFLQVIL